MCKELNVASFFSGAGGLDTGFKRSGYNIVLANDIWKDAARTFKANHPNVHFIEENIRSITPKTLMDGLNEKGVSSIDVLIGGPPCQCFTRLNNNNLKDSDERKKLFKEYVRMTRILKPAVVVMENVPDMLVRKNEKGHKFGDIVKKAFEREGYKIRYHIFETEKYNVPQKRRRVVFIATNRDDIEVTFPQEGTKIAKVGTFLKKLQRRKNYKNYEITENSYEILRRIKHIPPGGYYENLPNHLKVKKVRDGKLVTVKRYGSYYRRLNSNEPALTITRNYIIHPTEDRYLSNREKAVLHTFPTDYVFYGGTQSVSLQIANAVPPNFAYSIAEHVKKWF